MTDLTIKQWILANVNDQLPEKFSAREVADGYRCTLETAQYNIRELVHEQELIEAQDKSGNRKLWGTHQTARVDPQVLPQGVQVTAQRVGFG